MTSNAFCMMTFSPVSKTVGTVFGVEDIIVNSCVMIFLVSFIVFNFPTVYILEKLGLSKTFRFCALGTVAGAWGRYFALSVIGEFKYLLLFQTIIACF